MDAQTKYNSRAAMLYKEKLSNLAVQSLKIHGTQVISFYSLYHKFLVAHLSFFSLKLHIDSGTEAVAPQEKKEEDFFAVTEAFPDTTPVNTNGSFLPKIVVSLHA